MELDGQDHAAAPGAETAAEYQLKVLSGRHSGAIMPLPPGRHSLGQDEESDFIFLDDAFLGGRVIVDVTGTEPAIEVTGLVKASLDGRELTAENPVPLPSYRPVEVGATRFAIGPSRLPWPEPASPALPPDAKPAVAEIPSDANEVSDPSPVPEGRTEGDAEPVRKAPRRGRWILWVAATVLILTALGGLAAWFYPRAKVDPAIRLRALLAELRLLEVKVEPASGGFLLKGVVPSDAERDSLSNRLKGFLPPVQANVTTLEEIRAAIQGVLDLYHMQCPVTLGPAGKAVVACVVDNPGIAKEMSESLRQAAPPETDLELRLRPVSEAYAFLNRELSARVLDHKVHPESAKGRMGCVLVKNQMDSLEMTGWNGIRASFRSEFGMDLEERWTERLPPVLLRFQSLAHVLDTQLVGVTVGEMSYITLKHRRKYFTGARLGGITLKSIGRDRLVLSLDNVERNYLLKKGSK